MVVEVLLAHGLGALATILGEQPTTLNMDLLTDVIIKSTFFTTILLLSLLYLLLTMSTLSLVLVQYSQSLHSATTSMYTLHFQIQIHFHLFLLFFTIFTFLHNIMAFHNRIFPRKTILAIIFLFHCFHWVFTSKHFRTHKANKTGTSTTVDRFAQNLLT